MGASGLACVPCLRICSSASSVSKPVGMLAQSVSQWVLNLTDYATSMAANLAHSDQAEDCDALKQAWLAALLDKRNNRGTVSAIAFT